MKPDILCGCCEMNLSNDLKINDWDGVWNEEMLLSHGSGYSACDYTSCCTIGLDDYRNICWNVKSINNSSGIIKDYMWSLVKGGTNFPFKNVCFLIC